MVCNLIPASPPMNATLLAKLQTGTKEKEEKSEGVLISLAGEV